MNKYKRLVLVEEENLQSALSRGNKLVSFEFFFPKIPYAGKDILVHRRAGGLGDMVALLPSLEKVAVLCRSFTLAIPEYYMFLFNGTFNSVKMNLMPFEQFESDFSDLETEYDHLLDMYCPCGLHEGESGYRPTDGRIENFAKALNVEPSSPTLFCSSNGLVKSDKPKILLQIGSHHISKDWPIENFANLAEQLSEDFYVATIESSRRLENIPCIRNKKPEEIPGYITNFDLVVGADSGIMHLSAALGIKTLWLFGPTSGNVTLPYYFDSHAICTVSKTKRCFSPCYYSQKNNYYCQDRIGDCMNSISVDKVYNEIVKLLA